MVRAVFLLWVFLMLPAQAAERYAFSKTDLARMIDFTAREIANPRYYALDYSLDPPEVLEDSNGETASYAVFNLIPILKGAAGVGPTYFINTLSGQVFRFSGLACERYTSLRLEAYVAQHRQRHPIPIEVLERAKAHYRAVSDPYSRVCLGDMETPDPERLSLDAAEDLFRQIATDLKLLPRYGIWSQLDDRFSEDYFRFDLEGFKDRKGQRSWRIFFMNAWTGEVYEEQVDAPCVPITSRNFLRRRLETYQTRPISASALAAHHAHFRSITAPQSANCLGDRLEGLPP